VIKAGQVADEIADIITCFIICCNPNVTVCNFTKNYDFVFSYGKERKGEGKLPNKYQSSSSSSFFSYEVKVGKFLVMLRSKSPLFLVNV
jgi:hypothetical protein